MDSYIGTRNFGLYCPDTTVIIVSNPYLLDTCAFKSPHDSTQHFISDKWAEKELLHQAVKSVEGVVDFSRELAAVCFLGGFEGRDVEQNLQQSFMWSMCDKLSLSGKLLCLIGCTCIYTHTYILQHSLCVS